MSTDPDSRIEGMRNLIADIDTRAALVRVMNRLPDHVVQFATTSCTFLSSGRALKGQCLPIEHLTMGWNKWVIVVYDDARDIECTIAHEIAHAFLGHGAGDPAGPSEDERERDVHGKLHEWGFMT